MFTRTTKPETYHLVSTRYILFYDRDRSDITLRPVGNPSIPARTPSRISFKTRQDTPKEDSLHWQQFHLLAGWTGSTFEIFIRSDVPSAWLPNQGHHPGWSVIKSDPLSRRSKKANTTLSFFRRISPKPVSNPSESTQRNLLIWSEKPELVPFCLWLGITNASTGSPWMRLPMLTSR